MKRLYHDLEFLDFEASSLDLKHSYPIEVGFTLGDQSYGTLIKPISTWTDWDPDAQKVHGIFPSDMWNNGMTPRRCCAWMNSILEGKVLWCDGTQWDMFWLKRLFDAGHAKPTFELYNIWPLLDHYRLLPEFKLARHLRRIAPGNNLHRAGWDAAMLKQVMIDLDVYPCHRGV